jgi:heme oxygenase (biliverdin-producing, ferredoxin)
MRVRTQDLHRRAERSGIVNDVLRGKASRHGYALLLRNLLPAYEQLEAGLEAHGQTQPVRAAARPELYRSAAIRSDLDALVGGEWERVLDLLPSGKDYERRVIAAAEQGGVALIAHAYTRYCGDLSGGQILKRLLGRAPGLQPNELSFYDFPDIPDQEAFKQQYRNDIDASAAAIADPMVVVSEAMVAFELNIAVSEEVQRASRIAA